MAATVGAGLIGVSTLSLVRSPAEWTPLDPAALMAGAGLAIVVLAPTQSVAESWRKAAIG